jgi:acetyl esterase/lipase
MKMKIILLSCFSLWVYTGYAQQKEVLSEAMKQYVTEQKEINKGFNQYFNSNYQAVYSLPETVFTHKMDSLRQLFDNKVDQYEGKLASAFLQAEREELKYFFDRLILDYPSNYESFTSKQAVLSKNTTRRLQQNLADFNKAHLLKNPQFVKYVKAYLEAVSGKELNKPYYNSTDNRKLRAVNRLIDSLFTDPQCKEYWKYTYLHNHLDNFGIKNISSFYTDYINISKDTSQRQQIIKMYQEAEAARKDHLVKTYKTVDGFSLDMHLFLPDSTFSGKRPVILFFHGGSWTEGKPDWSFGTCKDYAAKGWVACAIEYRIGARHGTLPFASVMDAKSAIRWIRKNAGQFSIDTTKVVASGNSSGGHLVLSTALSKNINEQTDDLAFSAVPNVLLVNAGVYDLLDRNTAWIRNSSKNENSVKDISPLHLIQAEFPKTLLIHGTNDQNCPYASAKEFVSKMKQAGNKNIEFVSLEGATHFIWFDPKYSKEVARLTEEFIKKQDL